MHPGLPDTRKRASPRLVAVYAIAYCGLWLALLTPAIITLSLRVGQLRPDDPTGSVSRVLTMGALVALISNPLFGALSDRTRSRLGGRRPWLVAGVVGGCASLGLIGIATTVNGVLLGWCLAQLSFNAALSTLVAIVPDRVPPSQRGTVVGILGVCMPVGQIGGTYLVQQLAGNVLLALLIPGLIGVAGVLTLASTLPRDPPPEVRPAAGAGRRQESRARARRDFSWAWASRVLFNTGSCFLQAYQPLFLLDALRLAPADVPRLVFLSTVVQAAMVVVSSLAAGRLSDRIGRRKPFVMGGAAIQGLGLWLVASSPSYAMLLLGVCLVGLGHGIYEGVDLALVTDVLPDGDHHAAKDLGLLNIANTLPQVMAPLVAPAILAMSRDGYVLLFALAGALAMLGAACIAPLRNVR